MKYILILLAFLGFRTELTAQDIDSLVSAVDLSVYEMKATLHLCDSTTVSLSGESTEGGLVTKYVLGTELQMIKVVYFGEMGKSTREYYLEEDLFVYVFDKEATYNRPIYWDENEAVENSDNEEIDFATTAYQRRKYYFYNYDLVYWVDTDLEERVADYSAKTFVGYEILKDFYAAAEELDRQQSNEIVQVDSIGSTRPQNTVLQNLTIDTSETFGVWVQYLDSPHSDFWLTAKSFFVADYNGDGHMPYVLDGNKITIFYEDFEQEGLITYTGNDVLKIQWVGNNMESVYTRFVN